MGKIQDFVEKDYGTGRPRKVNLRLVIDGIRYLIRTGCPWRNVPIQYEKKVGIMVLF